MITPAVLLLAEQTSTAQACALLGKSRGRHCRDRQPVPVVPVQRTPRPAPPNALTAAEQDEIIKVLIGPRFCDNFVAQTWATLLDGGLYLAPMSTMHRLLRLIGTSGDRRDQATHPTRARPELVATKPGQVWSWDITKLRGPERGVYYDLYVIIDIYSRYVVGWTVAAREDADIAKSLIESAAQVHGAPDSLHADRGTSMTSKPVAQLLVNLGVARSHSWPHVSNDNPLSEAAFKTLKYAPAFPGGLGSVADARASARGSSVTTTTSTATEARGRDMLVVPTPSAEESHELCLTVRRCCSRCPGSGSCTCRWSRTGAVGSSSRASLVRAAAPRAACCRGG